MNEKNKIFDLETRTKRFAKDCRKLIRNIKLDLCNIEDCKQLTRSSGSVGANCIEANEALSKKDYVFRIKVCRKEAKESILWLDLIEINDKMNIERERLVNEATELMKIFGAIISKVENSLKSTTT